MRFYLSYIQFAHIDSPSLKLVEGSVSDGESDGEGDNASNKTHTKADNLSLVDGVSVGGHGGEGGRESHEGGLGVSGGFRLRDFSHYTDGVDPEGSRLGRGESESLGEADDDKKSNDGRGVHICRFLRETKTKHEQKRIKKLG